MRRNIISTLFIIAVIAGSVACGGGRKRVTDGSEEGTRAAAGGFVVSLSDSLISHRGADTLDFGRVREGEQVEMRRALINIYAMEVLEFELPRVRLRVECSKGTYIRSIAMELGEKLASGAHLTSLRRTRSGEYKAEDGLSMEKIENLLTEMKQNRDSHV